MLDVVVREQLLKMLIWYVGVQTDFQECPGKAGKYLKQSVDPDTWKLLESTYADAQTEHIWDSLFAMEDLFRQTGRYVAEHFSFNYPEQDDQNVTRYLQHVRKLPRSAETIYS
jgi:aminoglycoside 6-adenylyltransferase